MSQTQQGQPPGGQQATQPPPAPVAATQAAPSPLAQDRGHLPKSRVKHWVDDELGTLVIDVAQVLLAGAAIFLIIQEGDTMKAFGCMFANLLLSTLENEKRPVRFIEAAFNGFFFFCWLVMHDWEWVFVSGFLLILLNGMELWVIIHAFLHEGSKEEAHVP